MFASVILKKDIRHQIRLFIFFIFSGYLIGGNFFRFIRIPFFSDGILISEFFLYSLSLVYLFFHPVITRQILYGIFVSMVIYFSTSYGICMHGWNFRSALYCPRTIALILSGIIIGKATFEIFQDNFEVLLEKLVKVYAIGCVLGFLVRIFFPSSVLFWLFLQKFGIFFQGDPHINRYVSVYLDPNYYSAIAGLPLLLAWSLFEKTQKRSYLVISLMLFVSIILTWSRSGIAASMMLLSCMGFLRLQNLQLKVFRIKAFFGGLACVGMAAFLVLVCADSLLGFLERFSTMKTDMSALARVNSALFGLSLLNESPFLGVGYNYLSYFLEQSGFNTLSMLDSSLLSMAVCFGIIFLMAFLMAYFIWGVKLCSFSMILKKKDPWRANLLIGFLFYLTISIFFTSNFNNLIFYQFWLMPVIVLCTYFSLYKKQKCSEGNI